MLKVGLVGEQPVEVATEKEATDWINAKVTELRGYAPNQKWETSLDLTVAGRVNVLVLKTRRNRALKFYYELLN